MPFPEKKRIIYHNNSLDEVICQLRFPPILKIDTEIPVTFQEQLCGDFPEYSESIEGMIEFIPDLKGLSIPDKIPQIIQTPGNKNYQFFSEDKLWKLNLTRTFLALSTKKYTRWEEFKSKFAVPIEALLKIYSPKYFTRVGLRYINIINPVKLGLNDLDWCDLLQPYLLGIHGVSEISQFVENVENKYEIKLADKISKVRIISKLVRSKTGETSYLIDSDFFSTNIVKIDDTFDKLDYLSVRGSRLIQWLITEKLHKAMIPEEI